MEENYTPEEVQQHITKLSAKQSLNEEEQDSFDRNKGHIQTMLAKDWFSEGCTAEQKADLEKYL